MQSLAEFLGVPTAEHPTASFDPEQKPLTPKAFCQAVLDSQEFRSYILNGLTLGTIPAPLLTRVMDVAGWPKAVAQVEVTTIPGLDGLSPAELRAHLQQRLESLATMMHMLEEQDPTTDIIH